MTNEGSAFSTVRAIAATSCDHRKGARRQYTPLRPTKLVTDRPCPKPSTQPAERSPDARSASRMRSSRSPRSCARHRLVEGLVHEQLEHAPVARREPRRARREPRHAGRTRRSCSASSTGCIRPTSRYILEALPLDERLYIWDLVKAERDGEILLEVSDAGPRIADLVDGHRGARRRRRDARRRRDRASSRPTCRRR